MRHVDHDGVRGQRQIREAFDLTRPPIGPDISWREKATER